MPKKAITKIFAKMIQLYRSGILFGAESGMAGQDLFGTMTRGWKAIKQSRKAYSSDEMMKIIQSIIERKK